MDIECDSQSPIADSFAQYLALLRLEVGDECVLDAVSDIETVKSCLSSVFSVGFSPPDSQTHGYPVHKARLGTRIHPEWIWISPNMVPRGFVRATDRRYGELKDLLPGTAARFPELPAHSYILKATAGVRLKVIDALARSKHIVRPLGEYVKGI